jgi:hypothetical protein
LIGQTFGNGIQTWLLFQVYVPGKDLADHCCFYRIDSHTCWITGTFCIQDVAVECFSPRQELSRTQLGQPATTHTICDQRTFILGHSTSDLQDQLVMWIIAHWTVQKLYSTAVAFQLFQQQHLVDVLACQTVWRSDHNYLELSHCRSIAQAIETGPAQSGSAVPIVAKDMFIR